MYVVTQLYHDYDPKEDCPIDSRFVDMYNVIDLFKTFNKAVECAKQINKDFEMDCASRLRMKYTDLKKLLIIKIILNISKTIMNYLKMNIVSQKIQFLTIKIILMYLNTVK